MAMDTAEVTEKAPVTESDAVYVSYKEVRAPSSQWAFLQTR